MKDFIARLNKAFENRVRLGIMSTLMVNEKVDFNTMKEILDISDGNIASHITSLEKAGYVKVEKRFMGKKPNTVYKVTSTGKKAFVQHLDALENLLKQH